MQTWHNKISEARVSQNIFIRHKEKYIVKCALGEHVEGSWTRWSPEIPSNFNHSMKQLSKNKNYKLNWSEYQQKSPAILIAPLNKCSSDPSFSIFRDLADLLNTLNFLSPPDYFFSTEASGYLSLNNDTNGCSHPQPQPCGQSFRVILVFYECLHVQTPF